MMNLREHLLRTRNADGGWGYQPGNLSRLEPTCWGLLALAAGDGKALARWPVTDGLLLERASGTANYAFHGLGLITLRTLRIEHSATNRTLLDGLQRVKGEAIPPSTINRQDNSLQAWSWISGTFSWVEPTAWCLLALKKWQRAGAAVDQARIDTAERVLIDRCCLEGGWNYGNSNMLGQELKPFVPTTALALLALQDRQALPEVKRSLAFLERHAMKEGSATALSLALMALRAFGLPVRAVRETLLERLPTTLALGRQSAMAMALYAVGEAQDHAAVLL